MTRPIAAPLALCLGLTPALSLACEGPMPGMAEGASVSVGRMVDRVWELKTIDADPIPEAADVWLTITPEGAVSGRSGCNRYAGRAELDAGAVVFGPLAGTRMACDERTMELEQAYLAALTEVRGFLVGPEGGLWLIAADGSPRLCFR